MLVRKVYDTQGNYLESFSGSVDHILALYGAFRKSCEMLEGLIPVEDIDMFLERTQVLTIKTCLFGFIKIKEQKHVVP